MYPEEYGALEVLAWLQCMHWLRAHGLSAMQRAREWLLAGGVPWPLPLWMPARATRAVSGIIVGQDSKCLSYVSNLMVWFPWTDQQAL